jgi:DNA-binding CsgD family transcriptional regulator/PAS domain-containing protein
MNAATRRELLMALLDRLYQAPGSSAGWKAFVDDLCNALGGSAGSVMSHACRAGRVQRAETFGAAPEVDDQCRVGHDLWAHGPVTQHLTSPRAGSGHEFFETVVFGRTAPCHESGRQHDPVDDLAAGLIDVSEDGSACWSGHRAAGRTPFGKSDMALLRALSPHVTIALQLHRRLASAETSAMNVRRALDRLAQGVLLVARTGRVLHRNAAAAAIVEARDGLTIHAGALRAIRPGDTSVLRAAIHRAAPAGRSGSPRQERLDVVRPSGRRAYVVLVTPVTSGLVTPALDSPAAMVFVADPERFVAPPGHRLRTLFGLTRSEVRVALALLDTPNAALAARKLDVRVSTIRSHLRRLFLKTHTTGQADLIRLLLSLSNPAVE